MAKKLAALKPRPLAGVVFLAIFGGSLLVAGYLFQHAAAQKQEALRRHVHDLALGAAALVNVDEHEKLIRKDQIDSTQYRQVLAPLRRFHLKHPGVQYVRTVRVAADDQQTFVLETSADRDVRDSQLRSGRSQALDPFLGSNPGTAVGRQTLPDLRAGNSVVLPGIHENEHGRYIEARAPLVDAQGRYVGYLGLDYALDSYERQLDEVRWAGVIALGLALLLASVLSRAAYFMRQQTLETYALAQEQRDLAVKATEAKSELLAIATHDLKNPLSAIAGMSGLLLQMVKARPDRDARKDDIEALETINASAKHMSEIVRGVLLNEGLEQGGLSLDAGPVDLSAIAAEVVRFNTPAAKKKNLTLQARLPARLDATADRKLLREAFDNYVSNAVKYSPPGRTVTVELAAAGGDAAEFAVRDEGPGLSAEDQARLFQKFTKLTPRPTGGESSTGLGLSIVKVIAGLHHGQVGCESELGHGARFWFRLPLRPSSSG